MTWASTWSMDSCPECCGSVGCPCDTGAIPDNLSAAVTYLSGFCSGMGSFSFSMTRSGGSTSWSFFGFACDLPFFGSFQCVNIGGGVYKFTISMSFGADLSMSATSTSITCSPFQIEFASVDLVWSGSNGSAIPCCPLSDTGIPTVIGNFKIVVTP